MMELLGPLAIPCIICLFIGIVLLVVEMFTPGFGVAGILGVTSMLAVIVMQFISNTPITALIITAVILLIIIIALISFVRSFQKGSLSRSKIVLQDDISGSSSPIEAVRNDDLIGRTGKAITPLHPAGLIELDGKRYNVQTFGNFIDAGSEVIVMAVEGLNIFVR